VLVLGGLVWRSRADLRSAESELAAAETAAQALGGRRQRP
jgi:hypothetical protein